MKQILKAVYENGIFRPVSGIEDLKPGQEVILRVEPIELPDGLSPEQLQGTRLTPEQLEWARQQFTEEEVVAGLRELREKGGMELHEFLPELEQMVAESERTKR